MKLILIKQNGGRRELDPEDVAHASSYGRGESPRLLLRLKRDKGSLTLVGNEARRVWALLGEFIAGLRAARIRRPSLER